MGEMKIGYSVPTILCQIIRQSQDIASEARWIQFYAHSEQTATQIADIENSVAEIKNSLLAIECELHNLKGEDL